jgi:hypothetical protein
MFECPWLNFIAQHSGSTKINVDEPAPPGIFSIQANNFLPFVDCLRDHDPLFALTLLRLAS